METYRAEVNDLDARNAIEALVDVGILVETTRTKLMTWEWCMAHDLPFVHWDPGGDPFCWLGFQNKNVEECLENPPSVLPIGDVILEVGIEIYRDGGAIKTPYNWTTLGLEDGTYGIVKLHD